MNVNMGIIKIEVNLPEAVQAIEEFRQNRVRAFEAIGMELKTAVGSAISQLLHTEMTLFLGKPEQSGNKRNGYKERDYALKGVGCIRIKMPQDRKSEFKSVIVSPNEQIDPRLKEDMAVLHLAGLSTRTMAMISKRVLGIEVSTDTVSESLGSIEEKALQFLTRPIEKRYWGLLSTGRTSVSRGGERPPRSPHSWSWVSMRATGCPSWRSSPARRTMWTPGPLFSRS